MNTAWNRHGRGNGLWPAGIPRDLLQARSLSPFDGNSTRSASLCGALPQPTLLYPLRLPSLFIILVSALATLFIRFAALHWNLSLPHLRLKGSDEKGSEE